MDQDAVGCWTRAATYNPRMVQLTLELMRMAWPTDWSAIFERDAPLLVEIGFGNGRFLLHEAKESPDWNFVGLEIAAPSLRRAANRLRDAGVNNVRLVRAGAHSALQLLCGPGSVQRVVINFPDPWPKASHDSRRLISTPFLELLATRMIPGAELDIATDHVDYSQWIAGHLESNPYFESRLDKAYVNKDPHRIRTKYERKGLAEGSTNYYFKWRRNLVTAPDRYPVMEELPMPHVVARSPMQLPEIARNFEASQCVSEETTIRFIDLYESRRRPSLIVDTYVAEQPLDQRVMIEIYRRPDGDYLIRLQATGFPRPTAGVHRAIACLSEWFCGLHREALILRHNLAVSLDADAQAADGSSSL